MKTSLDIDRIEALREGSRIGRKIVLFQSTSSTNDIAAEYAANPANDGVCVLAESQTKGRGRRGRTWYSEPGQSILCSVLLTKAAIEPELLTLTAAVAVAETLQQCYRLPCRIKWPNDILINEHKVAGILIEKRIKNHHPCFIVGIGINCNQQVQTFEQYDLNLPATSLAIETGHSIDRTSLVCNWLEQFEHWFETVKRPSSVVNHQLENPVIARWLHLSGMLGRHVTVECDGIRYSGFCIGIDPVEGLILQLDNSVVRMFSASHTSMIR